MSACVWFRSMHADWHHTVHWRHHRGGRQQGQVFDGRTEFSVLVRSVVCADCVVVHDGRADRRPGRLPVHITSQARLPQQGHETGNVVVRSRS